MFKEKGKGIQESGTERANNGGECTGKWDTGKYFSPKKESAVKKQNLKRKYKTASNKKQRVKTDWLSIFTSQKELNRQEKQDLR